MAVGIERMNFYVGQGYVNVRTLFEKRGLPMERFANLMMDKKAYHFPWEDAVTHAVNAARPIIDKLSDAERNSIEMLITATESGVDFGKSLATYVHKYLNLPTTCRLFEVKQACYGGTASLQTAINFVASGASPGAKALVISTDLSNGAEMSFEATGNSTGNLAEPSLGTGAVAMLISDKPHIFEIDLGRNGYHSYEVWDVGRPAVGVEVGDNDLSLIAYMTCAEGAYNHYASRVNGTDFGTSFDYLAFHTPFAGLVKSVHRKLMRSKKLKAPEVDADFEQRVVPSLKYSTQVGNLFSASVYLALSGVAFSAPTGRSSRVGVFSYGSGCASEFFSGVLPADAAARFAEMELDKLMSERTELPWEVYEQMLRVNATWRFGTQSKRFNENDFTDYYQRFFENRHRLVLRGINDYRREYDWS